MPIGKDEPVYRAADFQKVRLQVLKRAQYQCERCRKPHGQSVFVLYRDGLHFWRPSGGGPWRNDFGKCEPLIDLSGPGPVPRLTLVSLLITHLNGKRGDYRSENLKAFCQYCFDNHNRSRRPESKPLKRNPKEEKRHGLVELWHGPCRNMRDVIVDCGLTEIQGKVLLDLERLTLRRPLAQGGPVIACKICKSSRSRELGIEHRRYTRGWRQLEELGIIQRVEADSSSVIGTYCISSRFRPSDVYDLFGDGFFPHD